MVLHPVLRAVSSSPVFASSVAPYLVLDRDLRIVAANDAYLAATGRSADDLAGRFMFDAFPDNPEDKTATGVANLGRSLERVLRTRERHDMLLQRYDVQPAEAEGRFVTKLWSPVNSPIADDHDGVVGILHHVEDLTGLDQLLSEQPLSPLTADTSAPAEVRRALLAAARHRRAAGTLALENDRLRAALTALVASQSRDGDSPLATRRRQLWHHITGYARDAGWRGWTSAICQSMLQCLPGIEGAALTARSAAAHELLATTDPWANRLEQLPYTLGEGPAVTAYATGLPVLVSALRDEQARWPAYVQAAADAGLAAIAVFPLQLGGNAVGTVSLYSRHRINLTAGHWADAALLADLATTALLADLDSLTTHGPGELREATYHRVQTAAGVLSARHHIPIADALSRLRAHAFVTARPIIDVAGDVLDGTLTLD